MFSVSRPHEYVICTSHRNNAPRVKNNLGTHSSPHIRLRGMSDEVVLLFFSAFFRIKTMATQLK
jgi:hypothetical protein